MKSICIRQPWAWAIFHAEKDIENRAWFTSYRGEVAVHATRIETSCRFPTDIKPPQEEALILGAVIGLVDIVDVVRRCDSPWFSGPFGFVLRNPRPLATPVHCPGNVGIWDVPTWVEMAIREGRQAHKQMSPAKVEDVPSESKEKAYSVEELRRSHHQAYRPWTAEDDAQLQASFLAGATIDDLVQEFARQPGGIRSRLRKLGLETGGGLVGGGGKLDRHANLVPGLEEAKAAKTPDWRARRPNAGRTWTVSEDEVLMRDFDAGLSLDEIAQRLGRGIFAVEVRLCKLGRSRRAKPSGE